MDQHATADGVARAHTVLTEGSTPSGWLAHRRRGDGEPWRRVPPNPSWPRRRLPIIAPRDRLWRRDAHIAIDSAVRTGELTRDQATTLRAVLAHSDDTGTPVWAGQDALAAAGGWRSDRTVRRHLRAAEAAGWAAVEHRCVRHADGRVEQLTNVTVVTLPDHIEHVRQARKAGKGRPTPKAPQTRPQTHEDRRPRPPVVTPLDARTPVLDEPPRAIPTSGVAAELTARALRRARGQPPR